MSEGNGRDPEVGRLQRQLGQLNLLVRTELSTHGERLHAIAARLEEAGQRGFAVAVRAVADAMFAFRKQLRHAKEDE